MKLSRTFSCGLSVLRAPEIRWSGYRDWARSAGDRLGTVALNRESPEPLPAPWLSHRRAVWTPLVWLLDDDCGFPRDSCLRSGKCRDAAPRRALRIIASIRVLATGADHHGEHGSLSRSVQADGLPDSAHAALH